MDKDNRAPSWPINEQQFDQVREIVKKFASEYGLRTNFEYRPEHASTEKPILIQEYYRLFLTPKEIVWEGILNLVLDCFKDEKTLVDRIRTVVPGFASRETGDRKWKQLYSHYTEARY